MMQKFGKMTKKLFAAALSVTLCAAMFVPMTAEAKKITVDWATNSSVWQVSDGVTAQIRDGVLHFDGNGAIPSYTNDTLYTRPWNTSVFQGIVVGEGITEIGSKAFANFPKLKYITVYSKTFIKDGTAFDKIDSAPEVRIMGSEEPVRMVGNKIPYTSLDSWARVAQSRTANILYIVDDGAMKMKFRQKTLPNIPFVYSADNEDANHRYDMADHEEEQVQMQAYTSPVRFAPGYEKTGQAVTAKRVKMGEGYLEVVAWYLNNQYQNYSYGESYSNIVSTGDTTYDSYDAPQNYVFQIPAELQQTGRTFKVVMVAPDGQPTVLDDLDSSDSTITFSTNLGKFNFSIIYSN